MGLGDYFANTAEAFYQPREIDVTNQYQEKDVTDQYKEKDVTSQYLPEGEKPGALETAGDFALEFGRQLESALIRVVKGQKRINAVDQDAYDAFASGARKKSEEFIKKYGSDETNVLPGITTKDVAESVQSFPFSLISAGTGLLAGVPTAVLTKSPKLAWMTGGAASGTAAYRMDSAQVMQSYLEAINDAAIKRDGKSLTKEEQEFYRDKFSSDATEHGLWEAIPGAIGNVTSLGLLVKPLKKMMGKHFATKVMSKLGGMYGTELATETVTQIGQQDIEAKAGLSDQGERSFLSPEDWWKSGKEVAPQVFILTTIMGGAGGAGLHLSARKKANIIKDAVADGGYAEIPTAILDVTVQKSAAVMEARPWDKKLSNAVSLLQNELNRRNEAPATEAPVTGQPTVVSEELPPTETGAAEITPEAPPPLGPTPTVGRTFNQLSPEFFTDLQSAIQTGKDKEGNPFGLNEATAILESYKGSPGADPASVQTFGTILAPHQAKEVKRQQGLEALGGFKSAIDEKRLTDDMSVMAERDRISKEHPHLTDDLNKAVIDYQGQKLDLSGEIKTSATPTVEAPGEAVTTSAQPPFIPAAPATPAGVIAAPAETTLPIGEGVIVQPAATAEAAAGEIAKTPIPAGDLPKTAYSADQLKKEVLPVEKAPTDTTKTLLGKNSKGKDVYEDKNGVRYIVEDGISVFESVSMVPTRAGIEKRPVTPRDQRYEPVTERDVTHEYRDVETPASVKFQIGDMVRPKPGSGIHQNAAGKVQHIQVYQDGGQGIKTENTGAMHFNAGDWELVEPETPQPFGSGNKIFTEDKAAKAREILRKKLGGIHMGAPIDPEIIQAGIDLAGYYIEGGSRSFTAYSSKMIADLGDVVRPYLKSFYMAVRNYPGFDKTGMNNEAELDKIDETKLTAAGELFDEKKVDDAVNAWTVWKTATDDGKQGYREKNSLANLFGDLSQADMVEYERRIKALDIAEKGVKLELKGGEENVVRGGTESAQRPVVDGSSGVDAGQSPGENEGAVRGGEAEGLSRPEGVQGASPMGATGREGQTGGSGNRSDIVEPDNATGRPGNERQPAGTATGTAPEKNTEVGGERIPRRESKSQNHRIGPDDILYHSGKVSRINANIRAIQTLIKLEQKNKPATDEDKKILAQFTGWGAVAQDVFNLKFDDYVRDYKGQKKREYTGYGHNRTATEREYRPSDVFDGKELEKYEEWESKYGSKLHPALGGLLTEGEWKVAQDSALTAYYTDRGVIEAMWSIAERLGFKGGKVLEPGAGVGHFFGLMPDNLLLDSKLSGVELDPITGRILEKLYPDADIQATGFEEAKRINDNSFDLVISNFPFGNYPVTDKKHPAYSGWSVHNYFFARSIDAVKPGGLVISVTSHFSMDTTKDGKNREYLAGKADLVGAIRLPGTAFEKNAGTSVTTDILIFRKKSGTEYPNPQNWRLVLPVKSVEGEEVKVNEYFINNPQMVMGQHSSKGSMFADKTEYTLLPSSEGTLKEQIEKATDLLPRDIMGGETAVTGEIEAETIRASNAAKEGTFALHKGKVHMVNNGALVPVEFAGDAKKMSQALAYVGVRDARTALIDLMRSETATDKEIAAAQADLNKKYDAYAKKYGNFHKRAKDTFLEEDDEYPTVLSLETVDRYYVAGVKTPFTKIMKDDIFTTRTVYPFVEPKTAENIEDAVRLSVTYRNGVDIDYIASLLGAAKDDIRKQLLDSELAYEDPATGIVESKEAYLSGNVRGKMKLAEANGLEKNAEALKKVLPAFKYIDEVHYKIGSEWMPPDIIDAFIQDVMGVNAETSRSVVELTDDASTSWRIGTDRRLDTSAAVYTQWGAEGLSGIDLVEDALNLRRPEIFDYYEDENGNEKSTKNNEKTLVAQQKQKEIVGYWEGDRLVPGAFRDYVMQHPEHITRIEQIFNESTNNYVVRQYGVPSFEHFPNASHAIKLWPHQMRAVIRGLIDKGVIYAHAVGTGKTYMYASLAMELKRIKRARKPMIVVQGSTLKQFAAQAHKLYPTARILTLAKDEIAGPTKRQAMMAKVANGNWDMVIIAHSTFNRISLDAAREAAFIEEQLEEIEAAIRQEGGDVEKSKRDDPPTVKELRKLLKRKRERLKKLADRSQDNAVTFESLGVDALLIDEAHTYKRGDFFTKMGNIRGLDRGAAQKSFDFMMKCRYVQEKTGGKNVYIATGTPVSNTIAEVWTLLRYARPELLKEYGVSQFDGFASLFGDTRVAIEPTETGEYKVIERFNKYSNGVQLINMWLSGADVILQEDVPGWADMVPKLKNGELTKVSLPRPASLDAFIESIRQRKAAWEALTGKEKMEQRHVPIVLFGEAKKGSIDLRMVHPQNVDDPGSKVNKAVELAFKKWKDTKEDKGTQLIFCDLFQSPDPEAKKWINKDNHSAGKVHINPHLRGIPRFNLFEDIKKKLIAMGIPEAEIAIINESKYTSDAAKEKLFERVNDGAIRILMGGTEKLGIGVNVQERLAHVIHIDAPSRPMDFEQRNGRIIRPGNGFKEVEVTLLATVNSMDEVSYSRLQKKQKFTNQLLRGNIPGNSFEDPSDQVQSTLEQMIAVASGNPLVMKQYELENNIRELETLKHGHEQKIGRLRHEMTKADGDIPRSTEHLSKTEKKVADLKKNFGATGTFQIKIGDKEYADEAAGVEALAAHIEEVKVKVEKLYDNKLEEIKKELAARLEAAKDLKTGKGEKVSGVDLWKVQEVLRAISWGGGKDIWLNGTRLVIKVSPDGPSLGGYWSTATLSSFENEAYAEATYKYGDYFESGWHSYKTAKGILNNIQKQIAELYEYPAEIKKDIEKTRKNRADMAEEIKKPFAHGERLEDLRKEYDEVLSQLGAASATHAQADDEIEIQIEAPAESDKYYIKTKDGFKEAAGASPVDNEYGLDLFVFKDYVYKVHERSTGLSVATGRTKKAAIDNAMETIGKNGIDSVSSLIQKGLDAGEVSPWYYVMNAGETGTGGTTLTSGIDITQLPKVLSGLRHNVKSAMPHLEALGQHVYQSGKTTMFAWRAGMKKALGELWTSFKGAMDKVWKKVKELAKSERGSIKFGTKEENPVEQATEDIIKDKDKYDPKAKMPEGTATKDTTAEKLNEWIKDGTDAVVQTIVSKLPANIHHMSVLEKFLKSPEWFAHPVLNRIVRLFMRDRNERYHEYFNRLASLHEPGMEENTVMDLAKALKNKGLTRLQILKGETSKEYKALQAIIDEGDTTWERNLKKSLPNQLKEFEAHIREQGATEDTIKVWKYYRQSYDDALDLMTEQMRQMIEAIEEGAAFRGIAPADFSDMHNTLKGALVTMRQWKGFYAPRLRQGNWAVQASREEADGEREYREHRWSGLAARRLAKKMKREGWDIRSVSEIERLPENIYQDIKSVDVAKAIESALDSMAKGTMGDSMAASSLKFNEELLQEVADMIKVRGFRSSMIHRKPGANVTRGYIEDPMERHAIYTNNLARGFAKSKVAQAAYNELLGTYIKGRKTEDGGYVRGRRFGGIDPKKEPKVYTAAKDYIEEQLRNLDKVDRVIGLAKSIATMKFLGFNARSALVNTTAIVTTVPPAIHQYVMGGKGSIMKIHRELITAGKDYAAVMASGKVPGGDEGRFLAEQHRLGWDDPQYTRDAMSNMTKIHNRAWELSMEGSMYLFGKSEQWNRGTTMLAAYRLARKLEKTHEEASEQAKTASDRAHGVYGRATLPAVAWGRNQAAKIAQMLYVYGKFSHNYLQMLYDIGFKKHNIKGAMYGLISNAVIGGAKSFAFAEAVAFPILGLILTAIGAKDKDEDTDKWVWDRIRDHLGKGAEIAGRYGLFGAMGLDISGSLSIGVGIPKDWWEWGGAVGGAAKEGYQGYKKARIGDYSKAAEHLLPTGLAGPFRAYRERTRGVTTEIGKRVYDETGRPYMPTSGETVLRVFGTRSSRLAATTERLYEAKQQADNFKAKRDEIYERYRTYLQSPQEDRDDKEHKAIRDDVRKFNQRIKDLELRGEVSPISFESMRRQEKEMRIAPKKTRKMMQ